MPGKFQRTGDVDARMVGAAAPPTGRRRYRRHTAVSVFNPRRSSQH